MLYKEVLNIESMSNHKTVTNQMKPIEYYSSVVPSIIIRKVVLTVYSVVRDIIRKYHHSNEDY